jgi:putative nucleotidyltransferase with HDIG domain
MSRRELSWGVGRAAAFLAAAVAIPAVTDSGRAFEWDIAAILVIAYAVLWNVELEIGIGAAVPTMLATIPMLFLLPPEYVPLLCVGAALASEARSRQGVLRWVLGTTWSQTAVLGPTVIVIATGAEIAHWGDWPLHIAVIASFVVTDLVVTTIQMHVVLKRPGGISDALVGSAADVLFAALAFLGTVASYDFRYAFIIPFSLALVSAALNRERRVRVDKAAELSDAYKGTALLLGAMIDADDGYTGYHSRGVVDLTVAVAVELGLGDRDCKLAEFAALLHDVGKIKVPKEILHKAGPLSPEEWEVIKRHPGDGADMLAGAGGFLAEVSDIVRHHHERYDGTGYPSGLTATDIPLIARIVCVCDSFSAITTDRAYRRGRPVDEAIAELEAHRGTQFDPDCVRALCDVLERDAALEARAA